jgi:hypothetical protein
MLGVETHVTIPKPASNAPDTDFNLSNFIHNPLNDTYTCPAKQTLTTKGNWYFKRVYRVKQYKTKHCKICTLRAKCTKSKSGRIIERHEFARALERNKKAVKERPEIYKQRQALVEHPFGTMKRQWGFDHIMTKKSMKHASADVGFIFLAYNLKRILNIIGIEELLALLRLYIDDISSLFTLKTYKKPNAWSLTYWSIFISSLQIPAFNPYIHK